MGSLAGSIKAWDGQTRTNTDGMVREYAVSQDPPERPKDQKNILTREIIVIS